ncbi:unnamed protein product [Phytophthora lilii]|uniref:Unnamed protein product n=1 Tax=Phytophthora lilii TaxID=2077276 RepID=A0A9W6TTR8_9STRA|nr:unnamed protein product [Phytophthora lilii]
MNDARRYSGYDEYTGIFGPLQAYPWPRGRPPFSRRGQSSSRNLVNVSKLHKGRRSAPRNFERRANFLAKRKGNRDLRPLEGDDDDVENLEDKENKLTSPTNGLQRQVWLPTRNFAFRQRAGKLDTRAIARLDLEKIAATTDIETIQRHLENLAFADVTLDDVQHYSDAYFLKLFQIAQLTLEYLMHVQDSLVDHSEDLEKQCEQLMTECTQLETENGQHETEIASLKREIRQKQRTMATLELMLLNASASNRINTSSKEIMAQEAHGLVNELLANRAGSTATEEGSITNRERHQGTKQEKRKQTKKKKSSGSSGSDSGSSSKKKKKPDKTIPLPKEVVEALEEKNQLAKQLLALQDQARFDHEIRDKQRQQIESQLNQMSSRVENYMEKLQVALAEIERKQEATKHDLREYTQEAISHLQMEAANAELLRIQAQKTSRAGKLENDDTEGSAAKSTSDEAQWSAKVEKLMDTFLRAQAQKQQEIDALEQESNKLWTKYTKLKKKRHHHPEPTLMLADITAMDANRFGLDRGEIVEAEGQQPIKPRPAARLKDKLVKTDEEDESKRLKPEMQVRMLCEEVQTDSEPKSTSVSAVSAPPLKFEGAEQKSLVSHSDEKVPPAVVDQEVGVPAAVDENGSKQLSSPTKFQQAAQVIGKVALEFLVRRTLSKTSNWHIMINVTSLEAALTPPELEYARSHYNDQICVQVEEGMTANDLRVLIAQVLSENDNSNIESAFENGGGLEITATMTYHRILLHNKLTGVELCGDMQVHNLKNAIEVEIIPFYEEAPTQINEVIESHAVVSDRVEEIKRVSITVPSSHLLIPDNFKGDSRQEATALARVVRLQALIRGFLAKKKVEMMKIDRLVSARLVKMTSLSNTESMGKKALESSWMTFDPLMAAKYAKVEQRLAQALHAKLCIDDTIENDDKRDRFSYISTSEYDKLSSELEAEQGKLSANVQHRIQLLKERLPPVTTAEYHRRESEGYQRGKSRNPTAAKIHTAVHVEVVRKRLKRLLAGDDTEKVKRTEPREITSNKQIPPQHFVATKALLSSWLSISRDSQQKPNKSLGSFDPHEIDQLANAYEEGKSPVVQQNLTVSDKIELVKARGSKDKKQEDKPPRVQPLTPRVGTEDVEPSDEMDPATRPGTPNPFAEANRELVADAGRSPRPNPGIHVISPFSKTPLISRRARRGTGFDNAR